MSFRKSILWPLASLIVAIIVIFTAGTLWSIWLINGQKGDGLVINISGAQRMLSQKMTKEVIGIVNELYSGQPGAGERIQAYQLALQKSRNRYHKALNLLVKGGEFTNSDKSAALVPATKNPKILPVLLEVKSIWKPFNKSIDFFLRPDVNRDSPDFLDKLRRILDNNLTLLAKMHKVTGLYQAAAEAKMERLKKSLIFLIIIGMVLGVFSVVFIQRRVVSPLRDLAHRFHDISEGEGDLTARVEVVTEDEIGQVGHWFNVFIETIQRLLKKTRGQGEEVAKTSDDLSQTSAEVAAAAQDMAEAIQGIAFGAAQQKTDIQNIANSLTNFSDSATEVAASASKAAGTSDKVDKIAAEGGQSIELVVDIMDKIKTSTRSTSSVIADLDEQSQKISEFVETINQIAAQTNLLALNAAIEAARAGEQGRGFAVVADEVRKLAESSADASSQIAELIVGIKKVTAQAVESMSHNTKQVGEGVETVQVAGGALRKIISMVDEVNQQVQGISGLAQSQADSIEQIVKTMESTAEIANKAASTAENTSAAVQETTASTQEITVSARKMANVSGRMMETVARFKLDSQSPTGLKPA